MPVPTLILSGSCGVGKTTIGAELSDLLAEAEVAHGFIDLDSLTWHWPPGEDFSRQLKLSNLAAVWPNYAAQGATRLVLAGVVQQRAELAGYEAAVPGAEIVVCRLIASRPVRMRRLRERMPAGDSRDWHLNRTVELEEILVRSHAEDLVVANDERSPREVALDVLTRIGWR